MTYLPRYRPYRYIERGYFQHSYKNRWDKNSNDIDPALRAPPPTKPLRGSTASPNRVQKPKPGSKQKDNHWPPVFTPRFGGGDSVPIWGVLVIPTKCFTPAHFYDIPTKGKRHYKKAGTENECYLAKGDDYLDDCVLKKKICEDCHQLLGWEKKDPVWEKVEDDDVEDERKKKVPCVYT